MPLYASQIGHYTHLCNKNEKISTQTQSRHTYCSYFNSKVAQELLDWKLRYLLELELGICLKNTLPVIIVKGKQYLEPLVLIIKKIDCNL